MRTPTSGIHGGPLGTRRMSGPRLPDFLIIGAMKAGTTSLFHWLDSHPQCSLPTAKEPGFFSDDSRWEKRAAWYNALFATIPSGIRTGEASTSYTNPTYADRAAARIRMSLPEVKLIFLAREPTSRLRSHYRHEVQRGRESRPMVEAVTASSQYLDTSRYFRCLSPYFERFPSERICIVRSEDLFAAPYPGWRDVLAYLGLEYQEPPGTAFNVTSIKSQFSRPMLWLWERELLPDKNLFPRLVRDLGKKVFLRRSAAYESLLETSEQPLPDAIVATLREDTLRLESWLGRTLWD